MSLYLDSSALLKRYLREPESVECDRILRANPKWISARHTWVEVLRNLHRLLEPRERAQMTEQFADDWKRIHVVELDRVTCDRAGDLAKTHPGVRTLDALHLAAAQRIGAAAISFLTYDIRQARVARELGIKVLGS